MALEPIGESYNVAKLKARLQKRFPNHNFDVPALPDTECKAPGLCKSNNIFYTDMEGNKYCGLIFTQVSKDNISQMTKRTCNAMVKPVNTQGKYKESQEEIF